MLRKVFDLIDNWLNGITMYRLVLFVLIVYVVTAIFLSSIGILSFNPLAILFSALFLVGVCWVTQKMFTVVFAAPANIESVYITALILTLIIPPAASVNDYLFVFFAAVLAIASKFMLAIANKHLFNPAAVAVVITAIFAGQTASWWVGTLPMLPVVVIGGLLIARKTQREDMIFYFLVSALLGIIVSSLLRRVSPLPAFGAMVLHTALFYFAFIMLTEPLTSPHTKWLQNMFAVLVGVLYVPDIHLGSIYSTPELALVVGNIFAYMVSPGEKLVLHLAEKINLSPDTWDFVFPLQEKLNYRPGQYMEWTLPHNRPDDRGNRRYFTLASSPTENNLRLGVKFTVPGSSFKSKLLALTDRDLIVAAQRAGEFTLPKDKNRKLVFIAGGIGITPFRSMLKYLTDKHENRDIVLFYTSRTAEDIVYREVFDTAQKQLGIRVIYIVTEISGRLTSETLIKEVPDFRDRQFYLSGPHSLVEGFKGILSRMGVQGKNIKSDFFPGFA